MKPSIQAFWISLVSAIFGATLVALAWLVWGGNSVNTKAEPEKKPLYWVAPMDPNYRRDQPGKSPMGMDLVPVYEENPGGEEVGVISISPTVINNLGVRTAKVQQRLLENEIRSVGYVQYNEETLVHIHSRLAGWINTLYIKAEGEPVKKGEPLYALYSPELVNAQEEFVSALEGNSRGLIKSAESRLRALRVSDKFIGELRQTRNVQQAINFYSPQDGFVNNLNIRQGYFVQPDKTLFSIGSLDNVWVEADVFPSQSYLLDEGTEVAMTSDYLPGKFWQGKVDYIYPKVDSNLRTVKVRTRFENSDHFLKPNMFVSMRFIPTISSPVLAVPRESIIKIVDQSRVVLALGDGKFKSINVATGKSDTDFIEIKSGLEEGEEIVISAQFLLDSESSKTSDFKRLDQKDEAAAAAAVWVAGEIQMQMLDERKVSVSHEAIKPWEMMAMTMHFHVADNVDIETLTPGTELHMQIAKRLQGGFVIQAVHIMESKKIDEKQSAELQIPQESNSDSSHSSVNHQDENSGSVIDHSNHHNH